MKFHPVSILVFSALAVASQAESDSSAAPESYSLWFVIFNQPSNCLGSPCGILDVVGDSFLESIETGSPDPSLITPNADVSSYLFSMSCMLILISDTHWLFSSFDTFNATDSDREC